MSGILFPRQICSREVFPQRTAGAPSGPPGPRTAGRPRNISLPLLLCLLLWCSTRAGHPRPVLHSSLPVASAPPPISPSLCDTCSCRTPSFQREISPDVLGISYHFYHPSRYPRNLLSLSQNTSNHIPSFWSRLLRSVYRHLFCVPSNLLPIFSIL